MNNTLLIHKILTYDDVKVALPNENNEPLVDVRTFNSEIVANYNKPDMLEITGETIYVREQVAEKLGSVQDQLSSRSMSLKVVYGYRHPDVQKRYFDKRRAELQPLHPTLDDEALDRLTHNFVAAPDIAGHPAGGAVDLTVLAEDGTELDMGTGIADYADPDLIQTFDPRITEEQLANRLLLHDLMVEVNFAPFYGEWWHFSYGDREWAVFYDEKTKYGPKDFKLS